MEDDPEDVDYINDDYDSGNPRTDMDEFRNAIKFGISKQWSSGDMFVFMNLVLDAVNRDDKFVSASLIDSWKEKIESEAKKEHEEKYTEIKCLTIGKGNRNVFSNHQIALRSIFLKMS